VPPPTAAFYFDLASPLAYLAAEQALQVFAAATEPVEWTPISAADLPGSGSPQTFPGGEQRDALLELLGARSLELGLQPLRLPEPFPFDSALAMRVATYAKSIGRTVPFAQAAFRQAFAGGRALDNENAVVIAAAACEMHPAAVLKGAALRSTADQLARATAEAAAAGVRDVPSVLALGRLFEGEHELPAAAARLGGGVVVSGGSARRAAAQGSSRDDRGDL
jgi:2-hydroxychromene-2-carboxylate isomerase